MIGSARDSQRQRLLFVGAVLIAFALLVVARLFQWQVVQHDQMLLLAEQNYREQREIPPRRGAIVDRHGHILALSVRNDEVKGDPDAFNRLKNADKERLIEKASSILSVPQLDLLHALSGTGRYVSLKKGVPISVTSAIQEDLYPIIATDEGTQRVYPGGAVLAQTLGFINSNGEGSGIESYYNSALTGITGTKFMEWDGYGKNLPYVPTQKVPVQHGATISLTIDLNIQYMAERELEKALAAERTITGSVVIMNPKTGEIMAMAGRPTFDPNNFGKANPAALANPVVADAWEPGSILKVLTMAAALDAGVITPTAVFADRGTWRYYGRNFDNLDKKSFGNITPAQILQFSSNIGTIWAADRLGKDKFYNYVRLFGIGRGTGIDLPGENTGLVRLPDDIFWHNVDLAANSYGQGISATPMQMAAAVGVVANKGVLMRPYVAGRKEGGGLDEMRGPTPVRRVVSAETAKTMTDWLVSVIEVTTNQAKVPGYKLAGKTGTANIAGPDGYDPKDTITSFVGYGPADDPQFLILVRLDRPQVHQLAADSAAPVFRSMAQWLLTYLKIPPTEGVAQR